MSIYMERKWLQFYCFAVQEKILEEIRRRKEENEKEEEASLAFINQLKIQVYTGEGEGGGVVNILSTCIKFYKVLIFFK